MLFSFFKCIFLLILSKEHQKIDFNLMFDIVIAEEGKY